MTAPRTSAISGWSDRQKAYSFGALLIVPPRHVCEEIDALRARYDPVSQSAIGTHISLTVPFPEAPTDETWAELEIIAAGLVPIPVSYGPLVPFLPKPGAALHIEPQAELNSLRQALEANAIFKEAAPRAHPFWAHMTIAEFITAEDSEAMLGEIGADRAPPGGFICDHLSYVVPNEAFQFSERRKLILGTRNN